MTSPAPEAPRALTEGEYQAMLRKIEALQSRIDFLLDEHRRDADLIQHLVDTCNNLYGVTLGTDLEAQAEHFWELTQ